MSKCNWLCRLIGHKWMTKRRFQLDDVKIEEVLLFKNCMRCSEGRPASSMVIVGGTENEETDYGKA